MTGSEHDLALESDQEVRIAAGGLFTKFLYILVPVFLVLAVPGIGILVHHQLDASREAFTARVGNVAARTAGALSRNDAAGNPALAHDLLGAMAGDRAIVCAEMIGGDGAIVARYPAQLGCRAERAGEEIVLPLRAQGALMFRFVDAELVAAKRLQLTVAGTVILLSFLFAVLAAAIGFRRIVGRPLRILLDAIRSSSASGQARPTGWRSNDELGVVTRAFDRLLAREARRKTELRALNDELEARVRARTRELEAAKIRAEAANEAKSVFLGQMSHELRTPLNAVIGFSELMGEEVHGPLGNREYDTYARNINTSGRHLLEVVNNVLDYVESETGQANAVEETVAAGKLVDDAVCAVRQTRDFDALTLTRDVENESAHVRGDPARLVRMLANLAGNAVKFTPAGGEVTIGCRVEEDGQVAFRIRDTGIGMRPEEIAIAMSAFGQVDSSLERCYDGAGLGLPVAERLARSYGGSLAIESKAGSGTCVTVRLPAADIAPEDVHGEEVRLRA